MSETPEQTNAAAEPAAPAPETPAAAPAAQPRQAREAADGRLRGISKSILIGVGGTGHKILLDVRKRLIEKYESLERVPILTFLQIDTDAATLDRNVNFSDRANLDRSEVIYTSVEGVGSLRGNLHNYPHLASWLDERALTGDIYQGAGAIRARGRLAFFWNYDRIAREIESRYQQITKEASITAAQSLGLAVGEGVTIYVVGSLLGGTGSGMFLDLAYTLRDRVARGPLVETVGIFTVPPNLDAVPVDNKPNAYAALLELNHYTHDSTIFEAQYKPSLPPLRSVDPPFQFSYLVDMSNPQIALNNVDDLTRMVGHSIFLDLTSEFQRQKKSNRDNFNQYLIQPDKLGCPQNYLSMGLAAVHFPADKVMDACAGRLAREIITSWMTPINRSVNIPAFTDQEFARLGLLPDEVKRQVTLVNDEGGETLSDTLAAGWKQLNGRYERKFPGFERVAPMLTAHEQAQAAEFADTDPNPDLLQKRRENLGEYLRQVQTNLRALIPAKEAALAELISRIVNNPEHRHGVAQEVLDGVGERCRTHLKELLDEQKAAGESGRPLVEERDHVLARLNRVASDKALRLIPGGARKSLDEEKDQYIDLARRVQFATLDFHANQAAIRSYEELLAHLRILTADLGRYFTLMGQVRAHFQVVENSAINRPTDVSGEVLFDPGRRVVDAAGNESYEGGDIEQRYQVYAGSPAVRQTVSSRVLQQLGIADNIYGLRGQDVARVREVLEERCAEIFQPIQSESVLEKFFQKYPDPGRASEVLKRVNDLSAPYIHLQSNAPGYEHTFNKEQTVIGAMNGSRPQSEAEKRFRRLLHETLPNVYDQQIANSDEHHQVLLLRERAAFPLRLMQNLKNYRYAYDQARLAGAAANPMHIRRDVRDWLRIDPPSLEDQKASWRSFVVAWAAGIVAEQVASTATVTGEQQVKTFSVTYTDNFGMPKTDILGRLAGAARRSATGSDANPAAPDPTLPPPDLREIVMRLCDDRTLHQQIRRAIDRKLEELGNQAFGHRLREHAQRQHELRLAYYDPYYLVLAGDPNRQVVGYLEEIGWRPETGGAAPSPEQAVCSVCGRQFPPGSLFCPQHGASLTAGGVPAGALRCQQCGQFFPAGSQFCPQHGATLSAVAAGGPAPAGDAARLSVEDRLAKLKSLLDGGLISEADFDERKAQILEEI